MIHLDIDEGGRRRTVDLDEGRHVIGRAPDADVRLASAKVSRMHALLEVRKNQIWVEDLGSAWGTYLGSRRLENGNRMQLAAGEMLRIAQVQIWPHEEPRPPEAPPEIEDEEDPGLRTWHWGDTEPSPRRGTLPMLRHLFQLISTAEDGDAIEHEACLFVKGWVDCDRVCLFEAVEPGVAPRIRAWWSREPDDRNKLLISRRMIQDVLDNGRPVTWSRATSDEDLSPEDSRHRLELQSAVAVPIVARPNIRGVLYADRRRHGRGFGEQDIELLNCTAQAVAMRRSVSYSRIATAQAAKIQKNMLPKTLPSPPGYDLEAGLHMCHGVGGDLYDIICRNNGRCLMTVGDVSGKGLPASLLMGATSFLVRALAELDLPPLEIYKRVHASLMPRYLAHQYVALFLGELDRETGQLRCVVAGVPHPLVIRTSGEVEKLPQSAFAAALIDLDDPPPEELSVTLNPGDLLAVYTDGYPEATPDGDHFLETEVEDQLVRDRGLAVQEIRRRLDQTVDDFVGLAGPSDDRTMLLLRRQ